MRLTRTPDYATSEAAAEQLAPIVNLVATDERCFHALAMQAPHVGRGNHENLARAGRDKFGEARDRPAFDNGIIGALRSLNAKRRHMFVVP